MLCFSAMCAVQIPSQQSFDQYDGALRPLLPVQIPSQQSFDPLAQPDLLAASTQAKEPSGRMLLLLLSPLSIHFGGTLRPVHAVQTPLQQSFAPLEQPTQEAKEPSGDWN